MLAPMGNPFVHVELSCGDLPGARKFYKAVFDWKFQDFPEMNWVGLDVGQGVGGGMSGNQSATDPTTWTAYVGVADVKETIAKAQKAGATIVVPFMEIPNMGALGVFVDPQGATLGVWQSASPPPEAAPAKKAPAKKPAAKKAPAKKAPAKKAPAKKPAAKKPAAKKAPAKKAPAKKTNKRR